MSKRKRVDPVLLKDFLQSRAEAEAEVEASKGIPEVLHRCNDILSQKNNYEVSMKARVWLRENSNIDEVLDKHFEVMKVQNPNRNFYMGCVIRASLDTHLKKKFPYNTFKFHSTDAEIIGKFLILHPDIKEEPDMQSALAFFQSKNVKLCMVEMGHNNELHDKIKNYLNGKRAKYGSEKLNLYHRDALHIVLSDYYESTSTAINLNIHNLTVEEMCEISNFEKIVRNDMKIKDFTDDMFEYYAEYLLNVFKYQPDIRLSYLSFVLKPKYN
jgi:hypothetical protein